MLKKIQSFWNKWPAAQSGQYKSLTLNSNIKFNSKLSKQKNTPNSSGWSENDYSTPFSDHELYVSDLVADKSNLSFFRMARITQGIVNYLENLYTSDKIKLVLAFNDEHIGKKYAQHAAKVISCNNHVVYLFPEVAPKAMLSEFIVHRNCKAGIYMSINKHNPNKLFIQLYGSDGVNFWDRKGLMNHILKVDHPSNVKLNDENCFCLIKYV